MIDESTNVFGINLKRMMKTKNITQIELSKAIGITQPLLSIYILQESQALIYTKYMLWLNILDAVLTSLCVNL